MGGGNEINPPPASGALAARGPATNAGLVERKWKCRALVAANRPATDAGLVGRKWKRRALVAANRPATDAGLVGRKWKRRALVAANRPATDAGSVERKWGTEQVGTEQVAGTVLWCGTFDGRGSGATEQVEPFRSERRAWNLQRAMQIFVRYMRIKPVIE